MVSGIRSQSKPRPLEISLAVRLQRGNVSRKEVKNDNSTAHTDEQFELLTDEYQPNTPNLTRNFSAFSNMKTEKSITVLELTQKHWPLTFFLGIFLKEG